MQVDGNDQFEEQSRDTMLMQPNLIPMHINEYPMIDHSKKTNPSDNALNNPFLLCSKLISNKLHKNPFSVEEDKLILKLVKTIGENKWVDISKCMRKKHYNRNSRQCKDRYFHYLNPNINRLMWTSEEDELLLEKVENEGKRWKRFESFFPGRTEVSLRNRYNLLIRKKDKNEKKKEKKTEKKDNIMSDSFTFLDSYYAGIRGRYLAKRFTNTLKSNENPSYRNDDIFNFFDDEQLNDDNDLSVLSLLDDENDFDDACFI